MHTDTDIMAFFGVSSLWITLLECQWLLAHGGAGACVLWSSLLAIHTGSFATMAVAPWISCWSSLRFSPCECPIFLFRHEDTTIQFRPWCCCPVIHCSARIISTVHATVAKAGWIQIAPFQF